MVDTMQPQALAVVILCPVITTIVVIVRICTRAYMKNFFWDDALCLIAWALAVAYAGVVYTWIKVAGFGYHLRDIPPPSLATTIYSTQLNMAQQVLYNPVLCIVKASIIIFLLRLGDRRKPILWSLKIFFVLNLGHMIAVFFAALAQCTPINYYWDRFDPAVPPTAYFCINEKAFSLSTAGLAILTDVLILAIPIAMLWDLRLNIRKKIAVGVALSLGWIVTIIGIVRFKVFYDYWFQKSADGTYGLNQTISGIEINVAIITCCGPAFKALVTLVAPKVFGTSGAGGSRSGNAYFSEQGYAMHDRGQSRNTPYSNHGTGTGTTRRRGDDEDADSQELIIASGGTYRANGRSESKDIEVESVHTMARTPSLQIRNP